MTFGAMAAWQAWLLVAAAAAAAAGLFYVKVRPPRVSVPSLLLWRIVLDQTRAQSWWERVRRVVSLVATIVLAVALALALTRPTPGAAAASRGRILIVMDSSFSMLAHTSGGPTRWARAKAIAHALAASTAGDDVVFATTADGIVEGPTSDVALLDGAIDHVTPAGGADADWPRIAGDTGTTHFITDGAIARTLDPSVVVHSVFEAAPNVAITAFGMRPSPIGEATGEVYLEIANFATAAQSTKLTVTRGTATIFDQPIDIGAGEIVRQSMPLELAGDPKLHAHLSAASNAVDADDDAVAWVAGAELLNVTVVSDQPGALGTLLAHAPGVHATFVPTAAYRPGAEDVTIFDRWLPSAAPGHPALYIAPPAATWLGKPGVDEAQPQWTALSTHPVLAGVDPLTIDIKRAHGIDGAGLAVLARSVRGTPLVAVADDADRRAVILTFGLAESNLAFAQAFPVLMGNAIDWLARPREDRERQPGRVILPASTTRVTSPDGQPVRVTHVAGAALADLTAPGFYIAESGGARRTLAVNLADPTIADVSRTTLAPGAASSVSMAAGSGRAWWLYALALALGLAAVEWWTWQRRITV